MSILLTLDPADSLEATAAAFAAIAWPDHLPEGEELGGATAALIAHMLRAAADADPDWAWKRQPIKPDDLLLDANDVARRMKLTVARLQDALMAARIARPFIAKLVMPEPPPLPRQLSRLSLNAVVPYALGDECETDPHNFEQRQFRRTLPVLHLAVALEQAVITAVATTGQKPALEALMLEPSFLPWFVARATALEPAVLAITAFTVPAERLVQVRLAA